MFQLSQLPKVNPSQRRSEGKYLFQDYNESLLQNWTQSSAPGALCVSSESQISTRDLPE